MWRPGSISSGTGQLKLGEPEQNLEDVDNVFPSSLDVSDTEHPRSEDASVERKKGFREC